MQAVITYQGNDFCLENKIQKHKQIAHKESHTACGAPYPED